ncbi:hypothetical protein GCM10017786_69990 [Amycolatopsis deserti]|uniref:NIPSNAP domain-containing protein n=1 Tax=Amycolatopsis deserti TaxID=185696 RepID=A0ABQ3JFC1_9PSEU|nr:NIPSNAP family protein [Amycolatopsis deserti]GHF25800.1 hypothetical protein GCM10017786_69990 [Amycolatopsis deserti]
MTELFELRRYTLRPGRRDELIALFDAQFVESQAEAGMRVYGQFRDLDDPDRFVWIRGFPEAARRAEALAAFYERHPAWLTHREAANATMVDSDDVLLLEPVTGGLEAARGAPAGVAGPAGRGTAAPEPLDSSGEGAAPLAVARGSGGGGAELPAVARGSGEGGTAAPETVDSRGDGAAPPGAAARSGGGDAAPPEATAHPGGEGTGPPMRSDGEGTIPLRDARRSGGGDAAPPEATAHPGGHGTGAAVRSGEESTGPPRVANFEIVVCYPDDPAAFAAYFQQELAPILTAAGAPPLASFQSSSRRNDYPRLPVREGERVFVWLTRSPAPVELLLLGRRPPERLRLAPTPGSWLR